MSGNREIVIDAVDAARSAGGADLSFGPLRRKRFHAVRETVLAVVQELPDDMTIAELRDELQIAEHQRGD